MQMQTTCNNHQKEHQLFIFIPWICRTRQFHVCNIGTIIRCNASFRLYHLPYFTFLLIFSLFKHLFHLCRICHKTMGKYKTLMMRRKMRVDKNDLYSFIPHKNKEEKEKFVHLAKSLLSIVINVRFLCDAMQNTPFFHFQFLSYTFLWDFSAFSFTIRARFSYIWRTTVKKDNHNRESIKIR